MHSYSTTTIQPTIFFLAATIPQYKPFITSKYTNITKTLLTPSNSAPCLHLNHITSILLPLPGVFTQGRVLPARMARTAWSPATRGAALSTNYEGGLEILDGAPDNPASQPSTWLCPPARVSTPVKTHASPAPLRLVGTPWRVLPARICI